MGPAGLAIGHDCGRGHAVNAMMHRPASQDAMPKPVDGRRVRRSPPDP